jgi:phosphatidylinositol glycan class B
MIFVAAACRYGHLTWEWKQGLRGYLHPLIFAALYKFLAFLHLDTPGFMVSTLDILQLKLVEFFEMDETARVLVLDISFSY